MICENSLISVIIPLYNRENTIVDSIHSVLNQKRTNGKLFNIELIVVDDCSNDRSVQEVEKIDDDRIKIIKLHKNLGANYARNIGIKESLGQIIAFQDSDDVWREGKLLVQLNKLIEEKADLVCCNLQQEELETKKVVISREDGWLSSKDLLYVNIISTQTIVSKREVFDYNQFKLGLPRFQDWEFALRISNKYKIFYISDVLVNQRIQKNSISKNVHSAAVALKYIWCNYEHLFKSSKKDAVHLLRMLGDSSYSSGYFCSDYLKESLRYSFNFKYFIKYIYIRYIWEKIKTRKVLDLLNN
ncbi:MULTISPECIES: glycosyltransferase family 2 protein [Lactococcus]|uniref:Glycosyltransferase family 2 protein n=1 Tax=Lactococcus lactis TaxID=1358 RepID=A0AAW8UK76_9LACT|nr:MULTISPECIES: glycosyltransferase family 2 protein [Lactococcus]MDT2882281.1 glycosyltransferase family 2 protein [Lactococcus lactis]MDT2909870.1 glycosyltransferase family 2 protein [Lactococcus lactis]MDT2946736.1 glycosyltransferase family 2 protein [Lactococcus lactis]RDG24126.1 hypothetical protein DQM05_00600 [Lactococcus cremoris]